MGTSLTGLTPAATYQGLIKFGDNSAISASLRYLSDGLGNDLPLSISSTNVGIGTLTGTQKLGVKGSGSTSATTSLLVQNSNSTNLLKVTDDNVTSIIGRASVGVSSIANIWSGYTEALQVGQMFLGGYSPTPQSFIGSNQYFDGTTSKYFRTGGAGNIGFQNDGSIQFDMTASGTAGNTILTANQKNVYFGVTGNNGIGTITPAYQMTQSKYGIPTYFICNTQLQDAGTTGQVVGNFQFGFYPNSTTTSHGAIKCITDTSWANGRLAFFTQSGDGTISMATEKMTLLANGNLSLGTTSNSGRLHIVGSGGTGATRTLTAQNSGNLESFYVKDDGVVGITANSPYFITGCYAQYHDGSGDILYRGGSSQRIAINSSSAYTCAQLSIDSTTRGFLLPRMTDAQVRAIGSPVAGVMAYNTDLDCPVFYSAAGWRKISHSAM